MLVYAKHPPWDHRIGHVVQEMRRLGPPTLRGVMFDGDIFAIEGSHRLAAADYLWLSPIFILERPEIEPDLTPVTFWHLVRERLPRYHFPLLRVRVPCQPFTVYGSSGR